MVIIYLLVQDEMLTIKLGLCGGLIEKSCI